MKEIQKTVSKVIEIDLYQVKKLLNLENKNIKEIYAMDGDVECVHALLNEHCTRLRFIIEE